MICCFKEKDEEKLLEKKVKLQKSEDVSNLINLETEEELSKKSLDDTKIKEELEEE